VIRRVPVTDMVKTVWKYANVKMVDCVTLGLEHAAVQQDGGGRCVMTLVLLEPTERTAPAPVCVRTRETVILSLASVTVPWDGRGKCAPTPVLQEPTTLTAPRSVIASMGQFVIMSMASVTVYRDLKETSVKSSVRMVAMVRDANNCVDVRMEPAVTRWMEAADVLQDGEVHCVTRGHVPDLSCMDQTVH